MTHFPEAVLKKLIEEGNVLVNDKAVKANYELRKNDIVTLIIPEAEPLEIIPQNIPLDILYEDDDVRVAGISRREWLCIRLPDIIPIRL